MNPQPESRRVTAAVLAVGCILFFIYGLAIIPKIGIQTDEAIFTNVLFPGAIPWFALSIFKNKVPLMVMTYLGATKAALFYVIFQLFPPSVYSLRIPPLILGTFTIPLFYLLLRRAIDKRSALLGAALLAADSSYLMTVTMDWGPVAIQHVCLIGGTYLLLKAYQTGLYGPLAGGCLLYGLGMWDKALFAWTLSGIGLATLAVFPLQLKRYLTVRKIALAGFFFILGALPLIIYNVRRPLETFRGNASFSRQDLDSKLVQPRVTLNGSALFGYLVEENHAVTARIPGCALDRLSITISDFAGERRTSLNWWAFLASLMLTPALLYDAKWRKPVAFCLVFLLVAWAQMLATTNAGGGTHHVILLWPFPLMLIACAVGWLGERSGRPGVVVAVVGTVLCGAGLLVHNHYLAQAIRNGAPGVWTDAIFPLAAEVGKQGAQRVYLTDWGMSDNLRMLHQGALPLILGSGPLMRDDASAEDVAAVRGMLEDPGAIFVSNTDPRQVFGPVNVRLRRMAKSLGYQPERIQVVNDGNGRPAFEIFRFRRAG